MGAIKNYYHDQIIEKLDEPGPEYGYDMDWNEIADDDPAYEEFMKENEHERV